MALLYVLLFAAVVATFVSHTVAAMILIPMVAQGDTITYTAVHNSTILQNKITITVIITITMSISNENIVAVGEDLDMPLVMIIGVAFAVSGSMALPFSSFPNVNSVQILVSS